ncbi:MAG: hypothetical protein LBO64_03385 [Desulfovibrio sp.]|jgi:hypothetical protein|nr:hypothetical protein [Desulfovibrio sp.]
MAVIGSNYATLADVAKRLDANGKIDTVVELLKQSNEVLEDMTFQEGNLPTGHKTTIRTGLPSAAWRLLNYGVPQSKSKTQQVIDACGMLEAYSEVDKALADLNGNTAAFRLSEDQAFLQAMNKEMATSMFYGDTSKNPERFLGLAPRYNTLNKAKAATAENVIDGGGTASGAMTSIYLTAWGANTLFGLYPKGSKAGFEHTDLGEVTLQDAQGGQYQGYRTHYKWYIGLCVRDWRYCVRIANIDLATITDAKLLELMITASERLPDENIGRPVFYMNRAVRTRLRLAKVGLTLNANVTFDNVEGKKIMRFDEIPVRRTDALVNTEAQVV